MSKNQLLEELRDATGDNALGTSKYQKTVSPAHDNSRNKERTNEEYRGKLTFEDLKQFKQRILPEVVNPNSDYKYKWFNMVGSGKMGYNEAVSKLYYSPVRKSELPEMAGYITYDKSISEDMREDYIIVKEMILCKIHKTDWNTWMTHYHHNVPAETQQDIYSNYDNKIKSGGRGVAPLSNSAKLDLAEDHDENDSSIPYGIRSEIGGRVKVKPSF